MGPDYCEVSSVAAALQKDELNVDVRGSEDGEPADIPTALRRRGGILAHRGFASVRSETDMLRYLRKPADKDLALDRSMTPLGSCTMKLSATAEMIPIGTVFPGCTRGGLRLHT